MLFLLCRPRQKIKRCKQNVTLLQQGQQRDLSELDHSLFQKVPAEAIDDSFQGGLDSQVRLYRLDIEDGSLTRQLQSRYMLAEGNV